MLNTTRLCGTTASWRSPPGLLYEEKKPQNILKKTIPLKRASSPADFWRKTKRRFRLCEKYYLNLPRPASLSLLVQRFCHFVVFILCRCIFRLASVRTGPQICTDFTYANIYLYHFSSLCDWVFSLLFRVWARCDPVTPGITALLQSRRTRADKLCCFRQIKMDAVVTQSGLGQDYLAHFGALNKTICTDFRDRWLESRARLWRVSLILIRRPQVCADFSANQKCWGLRWCLELAENLL